MELEKYRQQKLTELTTLETEYQNALRDIGLGHEGVAEEVRTCPTVRILSRLFPDSQTVLQIDIHSFKNSFERHSIFFNW